MNRSPALRATVAAGSVLACLGGALALTPDAGQAAPQQHSLHLVATHKSTFQPSERSFLGTDVLSDDGNRVGYDLVSGVVKNSSVTFHVSFALEGGEIFTSLTAAGPGPVTARIVGGTGRFKEIKGTVRSEEIDASSTSVDLIYTLR